MFQAAKIDQFAIVDRGFDKEGALAELHSELYKSNRHPIGVHYCLVARVVLGRHVRTKDGRTQLDDNGKPLFTDNRRSKLSSFVDGTVPSSLLAEKGGVA